MDINLLVVNVGNTRIALGVFAAGELRHTARVAVEDKTAWPQAIADAWKLLDNTQNPGICAASVNPALVEPINHAIHEKTGRNPEWVGRDIEMPIEVRTDNPGETGVDRVLNVAAAYEQLGHACAVVDAGTAVTVDFCDDQGNFVGGAIAPGVRAMLIALHEKTAKLPRIEFEPPPLDSAVGTSTEAAMCHGVYHSIRGLVREMVENYATTLGHWPEIIATGGDAQKLFADWELIHAISPDLTLYGIAMAYTDHYIKHQL
jgi:type III pantothenate kinase